MKTITINVPDKISAFYESAGIVEEIERNARFMYSYIADGSYSIETVAEMLGCSTEALVHDLKHYKLPLTDSRIRIRRDDSRIR